MGRNNAHDTENSAAITGYYHKVCLGEKSQIFISSDIRLYSFIRRFTTLSSNKRLKRNIFKTFEWFNMWDKSQTILYVSYDVLWKVDKLDHSL